MITGRAAGGAAGGSVALAALAVVRGAAIVRVHDVAETVDAVQGRERAQARRGRRRLSMGRNSSAPTAFAGASASTR